MPEKRKKHTPPPIHHGMNSLPAKQAQKKAPPPLAYGANWLQKMPDSQNYEYLGKKRINHELWKYDFRKGAQLFRVHHHPGTDYGTAVEDGNGNRLNDSVDDHDSKLAQAMKKAVGDDPAPVRQGPTQGAANSMPVDPEQARQQHAAHAQAMGPGAYRPGAFRGGNVAPPATHTDSGPGAEEQHASASHPDSQTGQHHAQSATSEPTSQPGARSHRSPDRSRHRRGHRRRR